MSDIENSFRDLREQTNRNRRQFLETEVKTCFTAIERAHFELSLGNTPEAQKELVTASRGADTIERFLRQAGEMADIEAKLRDLRSSLETLRREIDAATF